MVSKQTKTGKMEGKNGLDLQDANNNKNKPNVVDFLLQTSSEMGLGRKVDLV